MSQVFADMLSADTMLPALLSRYPQARPVFDRYGLNGCGGSGGPAESLRFFARTHGVNERHLLDQVREVINQPATPVPQKAVPTLADSIYRRFFLGGILVILTAGATWGATLLWQIGMRGKFTGVSIHAVNAHGHAQIYGWVGLFIMGFAYQALPRVWHTTLAAPRLAATAFGLMCVGITVRSILMPLSGSTPAAIGSLAGGVIELIACILFVGQLLATFGRRASDVLAEPYMGFIFAALFWLLAMAGMDVWFTYVTMTASDTRTLIWYVSTYQAPLRDLQIHGLALSMILGVSLRMLTALFDLPKVPAGRAWTALVLLTLGVAAESLIFVAYRWTHNHVVAAFLMLPWLMMTAAVAMIAWPWKLWRPLPVRDRSAKFVRIAYAWLAASLVMLLMLPVYQHVSGIPFSHAYYGAVRHAITVGFISMMILGMGAKVTATLNGHTGDSLSALWGPFWLVNIGCFLRCSLQIGTDWHSAFFPLVGISGTLEVIGLTWWSLHIIRLTCVPAVESTVATPVAIGPDASVAEIVSAYPQTMNVFAAFGFTMLANPVARRTIARGVTVRQAARFRGVCAETLTRSLRMAVGAEPAEHDPNCVACDND